MVRDHSVFRDALCLCFLSPLKGSGLRVAIVHARWNMAIIGPLVEGAKKSLLAAGVLEEDITLETVPGSYELPFAAQR